MSSIVEIARKELRPLAAVTLALLLLTAVIYPLAITGIGQLAFNSQANGSFITVNGNEVGSSLIGQTFAATQYFHSRPSAAGSGYDPANSGGSNLGPTSAMLMKEIQDRVAAFRKENGLAASVPIPADAVTASASGLDPDISPATARLEVARVARARGASAGAVQALVEQYTKGAALGFIGQPRVNVLKLNLALDRQFPMTK